MLYKKIIELINSKNLKIFLFILILINIPLFYVLSNYCISCIQNKKNMCHLCPREIIFNGLDIASREETLDEIIYNHKSLTRLGDGEFSLIFGGKIGFQKYSGALKKQLIKVLKSNIKNLLIGINVPYHESELNSRTDFASIYWKNWFVKNKFKLAKILNKDKKYYSSLITRFYSIYKNKNKYDTSNYIKNLKKIWDKRDVLIIEGFYSRNGVGNDLFNNTKSIRRIICPAKNAFFVYNKIIKETKKFKKYKNILILISLGPTAVPLSYELTKFGFQVIDIGHADIEYELYLKKYDIPTRIEYKYVNEAKDGNKNISNVTDQNYFKQIFCQIK